MRSKSIRSMLVGMILLGIPAISVGRSATNTDAFSGVWKVSVSPDDASQQAGKQPFDDLVLFEEGMMTASACASYGFAPATYNVAEDGLSFSTTMSTDGESIVWSGALSGDQFSGSVVWTKADGQSYRYVLAGERSKTGGGSDQSE